MTSRVLRTTAVVVLTIIVGLWLVFLRPPALGGDTDYIIVSGSSMRPTLSDGDLVLVRQRDSYEIGDVIAFGVPEGRGPDELVIHRIVGGSSDGGYVTQGDNRSTVDAWQVAPHDIVGEHIVRVPRAGVVLDVATHPFTVGLIVGALAASAAWVLGEWWRFRQRPRQPATTAATEPPVRATDGATARSEAVALRIHREYEATTDPAERLRIRRLAFETAAVLGDEQPGFDAATFLRACGTYAYDGDGETAPDRDDAAGGDAGDVDVDGLPTHQR